MKILIAEDDATSRSMLSEVLKKHGYEVIEASDGAQAWRVMQEAEAPLLAILDWMMPELDGLEVVQRIRALQTDSPPYIIMLTAKDEKTDIVEGLEAGANDYLSKPFDLGELRARVQVGRRMMELQDSLIDSQQMLAHQAHHDPLTGMMNRRAIFDLLYREIERTGRHNDRLAVGMCDIDHFKQVNDTYGHQVGDDVLCELSRILHKGLRQYDAVGRIGGEEFLLVTPIKGEITPESLYERLRAAIAEQEINTRSCLISITASFGVACATCGSSMEEILERADQALYQAKREGRNRVVIDGHCFPE